MPAYVTGGSRLDNAVQDYLQPPGGNGGQLHLPFPDPELEVLKPHLPAPGSVQIQPHLETTCPGVEGVVILGKLDILTPPSFERMCILDVKRVWAKDAMHTEESLLQDVQAQLYAWLVYRAYLPAQVFGRWLYCVRGKNPKGIPLDVEFNKDRVDEWFQRVCVPAAQGMKALHEQATVLGVPHEPDGAHCDWGRRCFVAAHCPMFKGPLV